MDVQANASDEASSDLLKLMLEHILHVFMIPLDFFFYCAGQDPAKH